jgi:hypothetical protein
VQGLPGATGPKGDRGQTGINGVNGLTPIIEFTYNEVTGDLEYAITGYDYINNTPIADQEW